MCPGNIQCSKDTGYDVIPASTCSAHISCNRFTDLHGQITCDM